LGSTGRGGIILACLVLTSCAHERTNATPTSARADRGAPVSALPALAADPAPAPSARTLERETPAPPPATRAPDRETPAALAAPRTPEPARPGARAKAAPVATRALRPGAVEMVEQRLEVAGVLLAQEVSGQPGEEMSPATRMALTRFQEANQLPATGEIDEPTVLKLGLEPKNIFFEAAAGAAE
jgi:hypothetical protein